jgi:hypothetical protein
LAEKAFVPARVAKGDRSDVSWPCWALAHEAVVQAEAAGVWAPAGATAISDPAARECQFNCVRAFHGGL